MTKKEFVEIMEELKSLIEASQKVDKAMRGLSPDFGGFYNEKAETLIVKILRMVFNDESDWIGYFIYELDWGKKWKKGTITEKKKDIRLKDLSDLYNLLKQYETIKR